jgi:hypothetical protein
MKERQPGKKEETSPKQPSRKKTKIKFNDEVKGGGTPRSTSGLFLVVSSVSLGCFGSRTLSSSSAFPFPLCFRDLGVAFG